MINFHAPFSTFTSYGLVAINIAQRIECSLIPIGEIKNDVPAHIIKKLHGRINLNLPTVKLYHQFELSTIGKNKRIGFPIFELDKFRDIEIAHLESMDELWVCSEWAKKIINQNNINVPTKIVPLGVDRNIFFDFQTQNNNYIFFSAGKWEVRKSQDEIVTAFNMAFTKNDNVELWLSMHNVFHTNEFMTQKRNEYLNTALGKAGKIKFVGPFASQKDLARVMHMTNCGVFPSKAEGWGLETLEMMSCGKQIIVTDYSGHTEYCNNSNSLLVPVDKLESAFDGKWFFNQGNWAIIKTEVVADLMKKAFKNGPLVNFGGIETAKKFSWENTAGIINDNLR